MWTVHFSNLNCAKNFCSVFTHFHQTLFRTYLVLEHQENHQGLAKNNEENYLQHFSRSLFQQSIPNLSHDSDRWQSSWHHSTLFLYLYFCLPPSPPHTHSSCIFAAVWGLLCVEVLVTIHLGRHIAGCKTRHYVWNQGLLS